MAVSLARKVVFFSGALLIALLGASSFIKAEEKKSPHLVISSPGYDAGTVGEGETISHTFEVKNTGDAELRILSVKPG
jgi:hypothetical protein